MSVCSGVEAATVAWQPLGFRAVAFAEIAAFPAAVLAHHYPTVPNLGDLTQFREWPDAIIDVLVGGTPCQSFSVAGLRAGLADPRGNLALTYLAVAQRYRPRWVVWENVPGVLSSDDGRALGAFLGGLGQLGYGWAYRSLDAQYFGLAQRRQRVFVVGHLGDWRRSAAVLFERASLSGHPPPRHDTEEDPAAGTLRSTDGGIDCDHAAAGQLVAHALRADGFDASEDGTGRGTPLIPIDMRQASRGATMTNHRPSGSSGGAPGTGIGEDGDPAPTIAASHVPAVAFQANASASNTMNPSECVPTLDRVKADGMSALIGMQVRRLTPRECERLQGFPDDYTLIPYRGQPAKDGPRYKALGNSMAVPVMRWIGQRMSLVEHVSEV